jgi:Fe2+ transport system protein FeoA
LISFKLSEIENQFQFSYISFNNISFLFLTMKLKNQNENRTLAELEIGANARILSVEGDEAVSRRLLEMGVTPGAPVRVVKNAPFGCPLEIRVRNSHLAIRRSEAGLIFIEQ